MKNLVFCISILLVICFSAFSQSIINIQGKIESNKFVVTYDLQTEKPLNIELYYTSDDSTWKKVTENVTGDIGENIMMGTKKQIFWSLSYEHKNLNDDNIHFRVMVGNAIDIPVVFVKKGTFTMGCVTGQADCGFDEKPVHKVSLSEFYIGKYEITIKQFKAFVDRTSYVTDAEKKGSSYIKKGDEWVSKKGLNWKCNEAGVVRPENEYNHPVIHVSWNDAIAFCKWMSSETGNEYLLPTEAQWEYAARGGLYMNDKTGKENPFNYAGSDNLNGVAWYNKNSLRKPHLVGTKKANQLGIYDMSGNVWEWCNDWYDEKSYKSKITENPKGEPIGFKKVLRGGGWNDIAEGCRISYRGSNYADDKSFNVGFRIVVVP